MTAGERRARARAEAVRRGWAGLLATPGPNLEILAGARLDRSERLVCLGLPAEGEAWLVCPAFEVDRVRADAPGLDIVAWEEDADPFALAAARMADAPAGAWAVEPSTAYHDAARLAAAAPDRVFVDGAPLFEDLRRTKDAADLARLARAIDGAWAAFDAVVPALAAGTTEREAAAALRAAFAARGFDGWALVQFGAGSAAPHGEPTDRPLVPGTAALVDWGGWRDGFGADLTRSFWWDGGVVPHAAAPEEYRRVVLVVRAAQRAGIAAIAPGVACGDVDAAARAVIEEAGWGAFFPHRLGHGLGREIHEPPYLVAGSRDTLREGDVTTVEPGVYLPGRFGVRWEDDVRVGAAGAEVLSARAREIGDHPVTA